MVPPFVVVEVVGIDLLRELGFVMILWPAVTFITVPVNVGKWDKFDNCRQPYSAMLARHIHTLDLLWKTGGEFV